MKSKKNYSKMRLLLLGLVSFLAVKAYSVNYNISFTGTGASTSVGNVIVENTTQHTSITVPSGNTLNLTNVLTAIQQIGSDNKEMTCKTDMQGITTVSFNVKQAGFVQINAFSMDGRKMAGISNQSLVGQCNYSLTLPKGMYVLQVQGNAFTYTTKLNVAHSDNNKAELSFLGTESSVAKISRVKSSTQGVTQMLYTSGDQLMFKGYSGNYATYVPSVPTGDATVNFNFVDCTDADGNHYATVTIGTQLWMAENLKTMKYSDGSVIPFGAPTAGSGAPNAYYVRGDASTKDALGLLYKWQTVDAASNGNKDVSPAGWHVPTYDELSALATQVGTGAQMWTNMRTNDTTWNVEDGTNSTGFSAKSAGFIWDTGNSPSGKYAWFWSTSKWKGGAGNSFLLMMDGGASNATVDASDNVAISASVRCIHN
jgi:uncharacterized protein (TIGR02145 family)